MYSDGKREKMTGILYILVTGIMFLLILAGKAVSKIEYWNLYGSEGKNAAWDAKEAYPFEEEEEGTAPQIFLKLKDGIAKIEGKIEAAATENFRWRMPFVLAKKSFEKWIGMDMAASSADGGNDMASVSDIIVRYGEESLGWVFDHVDISEGIDRLVRFGCAMKEQGRNFLFFENPEKYAETEGFPDYSEEKNKELQEAFRKSGLDMITSKELEEAYPHELSEMYYRTDHHWMPESAIWADGILCSYLNEHFGYSLDVSVFDPGNYKAEKDGSVWFGSQGREVTQVYAEPEDFYIVTPVFDTDLEVFISGENEHTRGSIQETLFNYEVLQEKSLYKKSSYVMYGYGDQAWIRIHNNQITSGKRILMIKTSFADTMYPFLAAAAEDLDVVDLRYFDGSLETFIKETDPDTVIVQYGLGVFQTEDFTSSLSAFNFQ